MIKFSVAGILIYLDSRYLHTVYFLITLIISRVYNSKKWMYYSVVLALIMTLKIDVHKVNIELLNVSLHINIIILKGAIKRGN